jgi:hypothetical protein
MTCNAVPFAIEDRVIIKFVGQSWDSPVVIGFLDNPKPCIGWSGYNALLVARGISGPPRYLFVLFQATDPQNTLRNLFAEATLENMTVDYRVNRSGWNTIPVNDENNDPSHWEITDQFLNVDITPGDLAPVGGGTAFVPSLGEPPYVRVGFFINSGWAVPEFQVWPYGAVLEVRIKIHGDLFANVAIKASFAPFEADCNISIQPGSNLTRLDYVRFEEDGT